MICLRTLVCLTLAGAASAQGMPRLEDYTLMWWAEGFPGHTPGAPWLRCIQTGHYAFALDTQTLQIPHFGPAPSGVDYATAARADNRAWRSLPPADLNLRLTVDGKTYRCTGGGRWSQFAGPRIIESGRFVQRADVTDLAFVAEDDTRLQAQARLETIAWPDRLALILAVRPDLAPIGAGEPCFGRVGGGYGFSGANHLEVPHAPELEPQQFTLELWAYVPTDYQAATRAYPWLVCKNGHEWAEGHYGLALVGGRPRAFLNIGGGRENCFSLDAQGVSALPVESWSHLAVSYDGDTLRLYVNGKPAGERRIGRRRVPGAGGLAFGRRQDNSGDGYHFRGVIDEVRLYDRALSPQDLQARATAPQQLLPGAHPAREWAFDPAGQQAMTRPAEQWRDAAMEISLTTAAGSRRQRWELPAGQLWEPQTWQEVALVILPGASADTNEGPPVSVAAAELPDGKPRPVAYEPARGWHRVDLDDVAPIVPPGGPEKQNDAVERVRLTLANPDRVERTVRLLLDKGAAGFAVRLGAPITGVSAFLLDADGNPTGIPVQLSKNWHNRPEGGVYAGQWFHGFSQVRLAAGARVELELQLVYGHFGGVAAASHAQLCLIGWGSNQLWDESALGSWGESICYEPDQAQAAAAVLDVRPLMVRSMNRNLEWGWTHNVGGADFFRLFTPDGKRVYPARMKTAHLRQCPVLTEVLYAGRCGSEGLQQQATVSLYRSDDLVRGVYRIGLQVREAVPFARFVVFQVGADSYNYTAERKMALGNEGGVVREWDTRWGGDTYRTEPLECAGRVPWVSLHQAVSRAPDGIGAWANRGIVIREWRARLGGKDAAPWVAERGARVGGADTSTLDLIPPLGVTQLLPGDFVEATLEHVIIPQRAADYYGPNANLRAALDRHGDSWQMIHREAVGNRLAVSATVGKVERGWPLRLQAAGDRAEFTVAGGLAYLPLTVAGLSRPGRPVVETLTPEGWQPAPRAEFWQTDYDARTRTWEHSFSLPVDTPDDQPGRRSLRLGLVAGRLR